MSNDKDIYSINEWMMNIKCNIKWYKCSDSKYISMNSNDNTKEGMKCDDNNNSGPDI